MSGQTPIRESRSWTDKLTLGFASVGYIGYAPFASGTVGSVPAAIVVLLWGHRSALLLILALVLLFLGIAASSRAEELLGRKDAGQVVIDEFVGMLIACLWLPATWGSVAIIFLLFRVFDIIKPFPAGRCERMRGGLGIMADDVVAGIYANLAYRILMLVF